MHCNALLNVHKRPFSVIWRATSHSLILGNKVNWAQNITIIFRIVLLCNYSVALLRSFFSVTLVMIFLFLSFRIRKWNNFSLDPSQPFYFCSHPLMLRFTFLRTCPSFFALVSFQYDLYQIEWANDFDGQLFFECPEGQTISHLVRSHCDLEKSGFSFTFSLVDCPSTVCDP